MTETDGSTVGIDPEDMRLTTRDGNPALELPTGQCIVFRTFLKVQDEDKSFGERSIPTTVEVDSDDYAWWELYSEGDGEPYPWVTIEPEVKDAGN